MASIQPIEGGSLLSYLSNLLFGGLDKIFDSAAEYEEEMGVLKQKTVINLESEDGEPTDYTLTIKLSPIRDKKNRFYVEAETNKSDFDVSSINGKVMDLNNNTKDDFTKMVDNLLAENKLKREITQPDDETESEEEPSEQDSESNDDDNSEDNSLDNSKEDVDKLIESVANNAESEGLTNIPANRTDDKNKSLCIIETEIKPHPSQSAVCDVTFRTNTIEGAAAKGIKDEEVFIPVVKKDNSILTYDELVSQIGTKLDDYMDKYNLKLNDNVSLNSSNKVEVTFVKSSATHDVSLVAINASCDIRSAVDMIETVVDSDDFVAQLSEDQEQSYSIEDMGDSINIEDIDSVETCGTYDVIFNALSSVYVKLRMYNWAVGDIQWSTNSILDQASWICNSLLNSCAEWVIRHTDHYPYINIGYEDEMTLDQFKDGKGRMDVDKVKSDVLKDIDELVLLLDNYYVNLAHDEQAKVDDAVDQLKRILTYA